MHVHATVRESMVTLNQKNCRESMVTLNKKVYSRHLHIFKNMSVNQKLTSV